MRFATGNVQKEFVSNTGSVGFDVNVIGGNLSVGLDTSTLELIEIVGANEIISLDLLKLVQMVSWNC